MMNTVLAALDSLEATITFAISIAGVMLAVFGSFLTVYSSLIDVRRDVGHIRRNQEQLIKNIDFLFQQEEDRINILARNYQNLEAQNNRILDRLDNRRND